MRKIILRLVFSLCFITFLIPLSAQDIASLQTITKVIDDNTVELVFNLNIQRGWYIYGVNKVEGPMPTALEIEPSEQFELLGPLTEITTPHKKIDPGFGIEVEYFEGKASFLQVINTTATSPFVVSGTLVYQTCNGEECLLEESEFSITVNPSDAPQDATVAAINSDKGDSIWMFLLIAFLAGLGGVVTPCVFPMIPMTVGFLIGGGNSKKSGIIRGLVFGLSVIVIYTLLGLIVALFQSTSATDTIGTHWIPNLIFALLFIVFAISFLGAFEITLPGGLANKADRQADKGGYVAAFFVALAMVIVSFSCTGPFVGSILAAAVVGGVALKPILGMAVFGLAFSLPFVIFSFFPSVMKKLPKSGGWLNIVKIVFAFVLLAFALKFLYNVDAYFGWNIITRAGFLSIWITLSLLLGLYFLGVFKTPHDDDVRSVGWGKIMAAVACFAFTIYMLPGMFGAPLKSISGMIPPADGSTLSISGNAASDHTSGTSEYASLKSYSSIEEAISAAEKENKPILLSFKSHTCSVCKVMEATVLNDKQVIETIKTKFVLANLYVDDKTPDTEFKTLGKRLRQYETSHFSSASQPLYVIIDAKEKVLSGPLGSCSLDEYIDFLNY